MNNKPNIMLVVIDTLRAQNMSCYGYKLNTSPIMDKYSGEGTRFAWAFAEAVPTQPAFTSILTGTSPIVNNIPYHILAKDCRAGWREKAPNITKGVKMLPQLMRENGYKTYAVDNLIMMRDHFYWGYDEYLYSSVVKGKDKRIEVTADEINANLIPLLERIKDENFFLFVHYWDPHGPYVPPREFQKFMSVTEERKQMMEETIIKGRDLSKEDFVFSGSNKEDLNALGKYDGEIAYVDNRLGQIFSLMEKLKLDKDTIVAITGDHGESFGTHNTFGHAGLHDTIIRIPLIFHGPGVNQEAVVDSFAGHVDIVPTILDFAGIRFNEPYPLSGKSLRSAIVGEVPENGKMDVVYCAECTQQKARAIRTRKWKFIKAMGNERRVDRLPSRELYDVANDPWEENNLIEEKRGLACELEERMDEQVKKECRKVGRKNDVLITFPRGVSVKRYKAAYYYDFQIRSS